MFPDPDTRKAIHSGWQNVAALAVMLAFVLGLVAILHG